MNTTCNPREHPFCTGVCSRRACGHKGGYDRPRAGFCRNLWFWCTQKEGMLQFTASPGSYFYAKLSGKRSITTCKNTEIMVCVLSCEGSEGAGWRPFATPNCFPLKYLVKLTWGKAVRVPRHQPFPRRNSFLLPGSIPANLWTRPGSCSSAQGCCFGINNNAKMLHESTALTPRESKKPPC